MQEIDNATRLACGKSWDESIEAIREAAMHDTMLEPDRVDTAIGSARTRVKDREQRLAATGLLWGFAIGFLVGTGVAYFVPQLI